MSDPGPLHRFDIGLRDEGYILVCGVDEAGRGPLAGPVVAAAVVLDAADPIEGLDDSKKLTFKRRGELLESIRARALHIGVGLVEAAKIDKINILRATMLAMERAVADIGASPDLVLVDGNTRIDIEHAHRTIVGGDGKSASIAAASIVAKQHRDELMIEAGARYPGYGFPEHMGYGTAAHLEALRKLGPSPIHRKTFRGVKELLPGAPRPQPLPLT